jgi:hypothetical protein
MSIRVAVLDDYQDVALTMTDWKVAAPPATASAERPSLTGRVPCHCVGKGRPT